MAPTIETISKRLAASTDVGYELSSKFFRVVQALPSAVYEYGCFASQLTYLAVNLEQIATIISSFKLEQGAQLLKDLEKLLDYTDDIYNEVKEALPQRKQDSGEVEFLLPFDTPALEDQIAALQVVAALIITVLQLGGTTPKFTGLIPTSPRFAEAGVNELKKAIRDLKCSQPKDSKRRGTALKRAKTHSAITEFLNAILTMADLPEQKATDGAKEQDGEDNKASGLEEQNLLKLGHFGSDPKEDGMPEYIQHHPDNVYAKVHVDDVDTRSMNFYNLPFSKAKENPNYYIIWKPMEAWECENLFQHTKKLRINEEHANIQPRQVIKNLLAKWLKISNVYDDEELPSLELKELDENLAELRAQDEKRNVHERAPIIRDRSWSPSPASRDVLPLTRRVPRYRVDRFGLTSKTDYWRSWGGQSASLSNALKYAGWQPVYMRGTDAGQTWFYGPDVIHIRRFAEDYTPQEGPLIDGDASSEAKDYLIISTEWIEEEALQRHGFQYQLLPSGHYSLDSRLTWGDIQLIVAASSTFREERLYRKFRNAEKGDLHDPRKVATPDLDYLNGPAAFERSTRNRVPVPAATNSRHVSHKLENLPEEPSEAVFTKKAEVNTPGVESHDSFIEVDK
ncbi:uncharacterized protein PV09_00929 [Verruconis gallopava]|uniref:Fungal N-terminal domain-containing protein n=1 Tax=Verruconis gallopava TaxID=253628 RepID=A0A0D1Y1X7_9PEZI|nr:uncharacterized protein PV09_00929 [Verruconis gallopava]KIW09036.1 hypothetical protein PV09_00929 [Verruconis gallopava]